MPVPKQKKARSTVGNSGIDGTEGVDSGEIHTSVNVGVVAAEEGKQEEKEIVEEVEAEGEGEDSDSFV
jgi:hypothetical protein